MMLPVAWGEKGVGEWGLGGAGGERSGWGGAASGLRRPVAKGSARRATLSS